jgi:peroxiredoxin
MSTEQSTDTKISAHMARARNRAIAIILTPILITLVWGLWVGLTTTTGQKNSDLPAPVVGESAPGFTFPILLKGIASLSDYRGKVVLVNVWATWCPSCIDEMPDLENLYKKMKSQGSAFEILGVSIDAITDPVQKWVDRFGITFPILLDPRGTIKKFYRTTGVPETFVIDQRGRLAKVFIGPRKWDGAEMVQFLKRILNTSESRPSQ